MLKTKSVQKQEVTKKALHVIYLMGFFLSFHFALPLYIESSFIDGILDSWNIENIGKLVGIIYSSAALITFILFLNISKILSRFGNYKLSFVLFMVEIITLLGLSLTNVFSIPLIIFIFVIHLVVINITGFTLDLFLENYSDDETTGTTRGIYLTMINTAVILGPFVAGMILTNGNFWKIFIIAAAVMTLTLPLLFYQFRNYKDPEYESAPFLETVKEIWDRKNLFKIMSSMFLLRFFYSWMIIYTPIYLNQVIGIPIFKIVGIIIPLALLPFAIFELILGKIADSTLGEKELLTAGFIIAGFATASLSFVDSTSILVWAVLMFVTRIGASFIEIMTETYFYKKVNASDSHLIGYSRNLRPLSFLLAPILATGFLIFFDYKYIFLTLGIIMFCGIYFSLTIKDTK